MINLLQNGDFSGAPVSPLVVVGQGGPPVHFSPGWAVWNNGNQTLAGDGLWTSATVQRLDEINIVFATTGVSSSFKSGPGGVADVNVVEVRTNGGFCGIYQFFGKVPSADASLWVYVIEGGFYAEFGIDGAAVAGQGASTALQWEQIDFSATTEIDELVAYSAANRGAWFYVAQVVVAENA